MMAAKLEIYKCSQCGNIAEMLHGGDGDLFCCGEPMKKLIEKTDDQGQEKHVPVIEKIDGGYKVKVGSITHPMEEEHYIEWIAIEADGKVYREFLSPGQTPEAVFMVDAAKVIAREHCSVHGFWKGV